MKKSLIGEKFRLIRENKMLTITQVSEDTCISTSLLSEFERGPIFISVSKILILSKYYNINLDEIFFSRKEIELLNRDVELFKEMKHFGERLTYLRKYRGLSKKDIKDILGLDTRTITKIESGQKNTSSYNLYVLAKYYRVSIDILLKNN